MRPVNVWTSAFEPLEPRVLLTTLYEIDPISPPHSSQQVIEIRLSDVNDAGEVAGTVVSEDGDTETLHAFLWSANNGTIELPTPSGMNSSAEVLNPQGVAAGFILDNGRGGAYQFDGSEMQEISLAASLALNRFMVLPRMAFRGRTVSVLPLSDSLLPHWADRPRDTVTLYGDISRTFGVPGLVKVADANNSGIVITRSGPAYGPSVLDGSILRHIQALIVNPSGWRIDEGVAINNLGQIVGTGLHNGNREGFILTPVSETAEPLPIGANDVAVVWDPPPGWHWFPPDQPDDQTADNSDDNNSDDTENDETTDEQTLTNTSDSPSPSTFITDQSNTSARVNDLLGSRDPLTSLAGNPNPLW